MKIQLNVNSTLIVTKYGSVTIPARSSDVFRKEKLFKIVQNFEKLLKSHKNLNVKILEIDKEPFSKKWCQN